MIFPKINKSATPWLKDQTILYCRAGSHAYGTNIATSDEDFRGVAIGLKQHYLGYLNTFEQAIFSDPDAVIYEIKKFVKLAADCNPSVLEVLFVEPEDRMIVTAAGQRLIDNRELFLSRKAKHTFSGYAMSQLKRIKTHRRWLLNPPEKMPTRVDFGLSEGAGVSRDQLGAVDSLIRKKIESWDIDWDVFDGAEKIQVRENIENILTEMNLVSDESKYLAAARTIGIDENFLEILNKERGFKESYRNWSQYQEWKTNRNPVRAAMEAESGYDRKHGAQLVRLLRAGRELLETGTLIVRRPDAQELLSIRDGAWSFDKLIEWAEEQEQILNQLYVSSSLPKEPDRNKINELCMSIIEQGLQKTG